MDKIFRSCVMNAILNVFIIFLLAFSMNAFADEQEEYVFDPLDSHHSMYIPEGDGPFPAILILHASTGLEEVNYEWASLLKNHGFVVYLIDSFKPRGWTNRRSVGWDKATAAQLSDVVPAYRYLSTIPYVNPKLIGILGFSMGGFDVLRVMERVESNPQEYQKLPFRAAASFYGVCRRLSPQAKLTGTTTIFVGLNDDRATINDCAALVKRSSVDNKDVAIKTYAGALHGFDNFEFPSNKEVVDERGEHYHIGYNEKARQESIEDLLNFFKQQLY